jgi:hypothetical protein
MANKTEKAGGNPAFFIAELSLKEERKNYFSRPSDFSASLARVPLQAPFVR